MKETIGYYSQIESFALVDGPGVRSVLFLQGCPFRCLYCHNPETWEFNHEKSITPFEAYQKMIRFKPYWKDKDHGGVTISGGEPLAQIDFLIEFAKLLKKDGIHVTIDTAGSTFRNDPIYLEKFDELLKYIDLIMLDLKCINEDMHKKITGFTSKNVIDMFHYLSEKGFPIWIRHVLVPTLTDNDEYLKEAGEFIATLKNVERVEVLPYHNLGVSKYQNLNIDYPLKDIDTPSEERVENAKRLLRCNDYKGYLK